jgi:hypothetical protein
MKIIALKVEARLKRLLSDLTGLEASELELLALEQDLIDAGASEAIISEAKAALDNLLAVTRKTRAAYLVVHGVAQKALTIDPTIPQPRSGT